MMQEKGFVLMDVMVASVIVIIGMMAIMTGYSGILNYTARNNTYNQTIYVAQQTLEKLKAIDGSVETKDEIHLETYLGEKRGEFYLVEMQGGEKYQVKVELMDMADISDKLVAYCVTVLPEKKNQKKVEMIGYYYLKKGGSADG